MAPTRPSSEHSSFGLLGLPLLPLSFFSLFYSYSFQRNFRVLSRCFTLLALSIVSFPLYPSICFWLISLVCSVCLWSNLLFITMWLLQFLAHVFPVLIASKCSISSCAPDEKQFDILVYDFCINLPLQWPDELAFIRWPGQDRPFISFGSILSSAHLHFLVIRHRSLFRLVVWHIPAWACTLFLWFTFAADYKLSSLIVHTPGCTHLTFFANMFYWCIIRLDHPFSYSYNHIFHSFSPITLFSIAVSCFLFLGLLWIFWLSFSSSFSIIFFYGPFIFAREIFLGIYY